MDSSTISQTAPPASSGPAKAPSLSSDETTALFIALRGARPHERELIEEQIMTSHLYLSERIARHYSARGIDVDDLRQVASLALLNALRRFDPERGAFPAFASVTIAGEIKRHFRDHGWMVRPPRSLQELQAEIQHATAEATDGSDQQTTTAELAARLDVDPRRIQEARAARQCFNAASIDSPVPGSDGQRTMADTLGSEDPQYAFIDEWTALPPAWRRLSDDQRQLLELRFYRDLNQKSIGDILGISQMQVSRRLRAVLEILREELTYPDVG